MTHRRAARAWAAASALALAGVLGGCVAEPGSAPDANPSSTARPSASAVQTPRPSATPSPTATIVPLPTDCRAILSPAVLTELGATPLNDPVNGASVGVQPDGSLVCLWRDPRTDTTGLMTTISYMSRGPVLEMLNQLADAEGFTCYTPDDGTRCEKTWPNETYPVIDGRTLFWREDILIDTRFSNLAPTGYTASIVESLFG